MMVFQVKVFDEQGNLKEIICADEVLRRSDEVFLNRGKISNRLKMKSYICVECKIKFESNSSRGAKYCKDCRTKVYKIRKKINNEKISTNL